MADRALSLVTAPMSGWLWVGVGGFFGAIARFQLSTQLMLMTGLPRFPAGTLAVNLLGCLLIGLLAGWLPKPEASGQHWNLLLVTGLLGGFTTFSAFGYETLWLLRRDAPWLAISYVAASVIGGLALAGFGIWLSSRGQVTST